MPTEEEIRRIIELWNDDKSYGEIARQLNGKKSTVQSWIEGLLKKGTIQPRTNTRTNTKNATEAKANYDQARRLELNNKWFNKIEELLDKAEDAKDLKDLAVPYGIAEDKRALLEGRPNVNIGIGSNKSIDERLNELAQRRSQRKAQTDK